MGTRCITEVRSKWDRDSEYVTNAVIYRHWDGYPLGHGKLLADFLSGLRVVNGIGTHVTGRYANGPGRLAAQLVATMQEAGVDPDLQAAGVPVPHMFRYRIDVNFGHAGGDVTVTVFNPARPEKRRRAVEIFSGSVPEFALWVERLSD